MPYRTEHGTHYHETAGCHGADIPCGTEGLSPCRSCCGGRAAGGTAGVTPASGAGEQGASEQGVGEAAAVATPGAAADAREVSARIAATMPAGAREVMAVLGASGFPCHAVGGCVRDAVLGAEPHDWDLATSATVDEMHRAFAAAGLPVHDTGAEHGTVTVVASDRGAYEVTTYRIDGDYSDGRHPDSVEFTDDIRKDLARRDLTINAMAWSPADGVIDPFGGLADLRGGTIRCVGNPVDRLTEDPLRIMRALRFAARLGFAIDPRTSGAIHSLCGRLAGVSGERRQKELAGILSAEDGQALGGLLREYRDVVFAAVPGLEPMAATPQRHPWHRFGNVWDHTAEVVANTPPDRVTRLAALLHDIGKPRCLAIGEDGVTHFKGHPAAGMDDARTALDALRMDTGTRDAVLRLVRLHDMLVPETRRGVRRAFVRLGSREAFDRWLALRQADVMGQSAYAQARELPRLDAVEAVARALDEEGAMFSPRDMALRGADLLAMGMEPGPAVGAILKEAFALVVDGELPNDPGALREFARGHIGESTARR